MRIDFSAPLVAYNGQPLAEGDTVLTLRMVACNALTTAIPNEVLTGVQKVERVELARRIFRAEGDLIMTADEVVLLKQAVNALYLSPVLVAAAWEVLDPR